MNSFQENSSTTDVPENLDAIEYMDVDPEELGSNEQNDDYNEEDPDGPSNEDDPDGPSNGEKPDAAINDQNTEAGTIDQDTDIGSFDQDPEVILNDQHDEGPVLRRSTRMRGTRRSNMRPRRTTRSGLRNLSRGIQTEYLRGQVTGVRPLQNRGERTENEASRSPFKAIADYVIYLWNSLWVNE